MKNYFAKSLALVALSIPVMLIMKGWETTPTTLEASTIEELGEETTLHLQEVRNPTFSDEEITMAAKTVWGEARGIESRMEQAAVVWVFLNRVDHGMGSLGDVVSQPYQFNYNESFPTVDDFGRDLTELVRDVVGRWSRSHDGVANTGRVIPTDYLWFGGDGNRNYFRNDYNFQGNIWDWSLPNPYEN